MKILSVLTCMVTQKYEYHYSNVFAADIKERSRGIFHGIYQRLFTTFDGRRAHNPDSSARGTEFGESSGVNGLTAIELESTQSGVQTLLVKSEY